MQIESKKKKLCLEPLRGIITQGEKMADTVIFRLPATYGALILSDLSWQIRAASEKNTLVTADLTASSGGEFCLVQWEVSADFTAVSGALSLMLVGTDSEGNVVIKFPGDDPIWIRDSETGEYAPPPDVLEQAIIGIQQAQAALESAQESLEDAAQALQNTTANFRILNHYDSLPELQSAITNPSVGDAYGVGDPTVVYVWNGSAWTQLPGVLVSPSLPMSVANGGTGGTTVTEALANLGAQASNNLLVNPRFKYNSRDQQSYTGMLWGLDGWYCSNITQSGNTLTSSDNSANIQQTIKNQSQVYGKTVTASIKQNGGNVIYSTAQIPSSPSSTTEYINVSTGFGNLVVWYNSQEGKLNLSIFVSSGNSVTVDGVKLELGSVSTLQAELDNPPPEDVEKLKLDMYDLDPGRCAYLPWHNENLLDNWYFVGGGSQQGGGQFPINQRGETSWNTGGYHLDRWKQEIDGSGELGEEGFTPAVTQTMATAQPVEESVFKRLLGKKVTISALLSSGEFRSRTIQFPSDISQGFVESVAFSNGGEICIASYPGTKTYQLCRIYIPSDSNKLTFAAIKVELGHLSTLARKDESGNWVLNDPPPNFQQELAKCQRYFCVVDPSYYSGALYSSNAAIVNIPTSVPMRIPPTVKGASAQLAARIFLSDGTEISAENVSFTSQGSNSNGIKLHVTGITSQQSDSMLVLKDFAFEFSADL